MPKFRRFGSQPTIRTTENSTNTTRSSAPVRRATEDPKEAAEVALNAMITAVHAITRFNTDVENGQSFASEYFCKNAHPELQINVSKDYTLPYGMDKKKFHYLIFEYMPKIKEDHPASYDALVSKIFEDVRGLNAELHSLPTSTLSMDLKVEDVLFGIASKYNLDDIKDYVSRKAANNLGMRTPRHQELCNRMGYLGFIPSDETCEKILRAKNQYDAAQYSAAQQQYYSTQY